MDEILDHPLTQFIISGLAIVAFIVALKTGVSYLPDHGPAGAVKKVVLAV